MEKHHFESLDSISATALNFVFEDMLLRESSKHPIFKHDDYEWHIGNEVFCTLKSILRIYAFEFDYDYETRKFLDIDVFVNTRDVGLRDICLVKKSKVDLNYIDTDYRYADPNVVSTINESKRRAREMDICRNYDESMSSYDIIKRMLNENYELIKSEEAETMKIDYTACHRRNLFTIGTPEIEGVIFHGPCTVVKWSDGDKTIVRCKNEDFDKEKGIAMAICKKMMGTNKTKSNYYDMFKKWLPEEVSEV